MDALVDQAIQQLMDVRHEDLLRRSIFPVFIVVGIVVFPQHLFKIRGIRNIRVDAQGTDGLSSAVVKIDGGLKPENVAQIQNIISREIGTEIENIHIMEK